MKHQYPTNVDKLLNSYPDSIIGYEDNYLIFKNNKKLIYDDGIIKNPQQLLENPCIKDQFHYAYSKGEMKNPPKFPEDPGRITNEDFFKTIYGSTKEQVLNNLTSIVWCPKLLGEEIQVTKINGIDIKLKAVSTELEQDPNLKPYVTNIGGTFNWRKVAGTNRLSLHSYAIAIDINVSKSNYWQWDCKCKEETTKLKYENHIPQKIVDIFEKYGFIWGGKWYHYDTMHFEYRPELL
jgi:hypothetical protein